MRSEIVYLRDDGSVVRLYRGLDGREYKSMGEADIADWMLLNGIDYRYEDPYIVDTRTPDYPGQYRPDFHIPGTNVYIEYWGINRRGQVRPGTKSRHGLDPSVEYRQGMEWKRRTHSENDTDLVELYSFRRSGGHLEKDLKRQLRKRGIRPAPWLERMRIRRDLRQARRYRS